MENLEEKILKFIRLKREDESWDFKQKWENQSKNADLLHDIICMANNQNDEDAYIIFGVENTTFKIIGIENTEDRKSQQNVIDFLKDKKFESGIRPIIEVRTIYLEDHELDILIIKNTNNTPYYLIESYRDVLQYHIYTRIGDTNTPKDKNADINYIEYLWKKRFLLTVSPIIKLFDRVKYKGEWEERYDEEKGYVVFFNTYNPEYTINLIEDDEKLYPEFYSYIMTNESTSYGIIKVKYYDTEIYSCQYVVLDSGRYITSVPKWEFLKVINPFNVDYGYKYFIKNQYNYLLHEFLYNQESEEANYAKRRLYEKIIIYDSKEEKYAFEKYVLNNKENFMKKVEEMEKTINYIELENKLEEENIKRKISVGTILNRFLREFRENI